MKIEEIVERVKKNRQLDDYQDIYEKLWKVDVDIYDKTIRNSFLSIERPKKYVYGESDKQDVLLPDKYCDIYLYYVLAMDDISYEDTDSYINHMIMFNNCLDAFCAEFRENNRQKSDPRIMY